MMVGGGTRQFHSVHYILILILRLTPKRASTLYTGTSSRSHNWEVSQLSNLVGVCRVRRTAATVSSGAADIPTPTSGDGNGGVTGVLGGIPGHIAVIMMYTKAANSCDGHVPIAGQRPLPAGEAV